MRSWPHKALAESTDSAESWTKIFNSILVYRRFPDQESRNLVDYITWPYQHVTTLSSKIGTSSSPPKLAIFECQQHQTQVSVACRHRTVSAIESTCRNERFSPSTTLQVCAALPVCRGLNRSDWFQTSIRVRSLGRRDPRVLRRSSRQFA